jgi:UDP-N-acetylmuramoyl-tripeptide--D-alanyl-D-alanine ligase
VRKGKGELFDFLRNTGGMAFAYNEYDYLHEMTKGIEKVFWYGVADGDVCGCAASNESFLEVAITSGLDITPIKTQLVGDYNLPNILCAVAVGKYFDVPAAGIQAAIEQYVPSNSRSQMIVQGSNHIILDAYNANPSSMKPAIENFARISSNHKILLLGGMMELGKESIAEHAGIVQLIRQYQWEQVVLVGGDYKHVPHPFIYFDNAMEAKTWLQQQHFENCYILVKGSRSMQMEKVVE